MNQIVKTTKKLYSGLITHSKQKAKMYVIKTLNSCYIHLKFIILNKACNAHTLPLSRISRYPGLASLPIHPFVGGLRSIDSSSQLRYSVEISSTLPADMTNLP
jgi:hypothetical protein